MIRRLFLAAVLALGISTPARATGLEAAIIGALSGTVGATAAAAIASGVTRMLVGVALSALSRVLSPKPKQRTPGLKTEYTTTGETNAQSFVLGYYATGGNFVAPPMSHGKDNRFLTYVIDLADMPIDDLLTVYIDGEEAPFDGDVHADYGTEATGRLAGRAWLIYHDGSQTSADAMLLDKYGSYPDRPWQADMILRDVPYAILTFKYDREVYSGLPRLRFEVAGIPLYDPRKDSTVAGGSGTQRWADPSTWAYTENLAVMVYNVLRGITLPDGNVWGMRAAAEDIPLSTAFAAMNACDEEVALEVEGTEYRYRGGLEVSVEDEPLEVIEELMKGCGGDVVEFGGYWHLSVGAPDPAALAITDDDLIISSPRDYEPFPGLAATYNAVTAVYPSPGNNWDPTDAVPLYNAAWEAEDQGRRLVANLQLDAVPHDTQVRRLMRELAQDNRRRAVHVVTLPHAALGVVPLSTISWTSAHNGYTAKLFEVVRKVIDPETLLSTVLLRERDPSDYDEDPADDAVVPTPPSRVITAPAIDGLDGWSVTKAAITDASGGNRRPAIRLAWASDIVAEAISWQIRVKATGQLLPEGTTSEIEAGGVTVSEGILPATTFEVRGRPISRKAASWTAWSEVTTDDIRLAYPDLVPDVQQEIDQAQATAENADDRAQAVRDDHDALVSDFVGDLPTAFDQVADDIDSAAAQTLDLAVGAASQAGLSVVKSQFLDKGWNGFQTTPTRTPNELHPVGDTLAWDIGANVNAGAVMSWASSNWTSFPGADAYVIEVEYTLISGALDGAGIMFDWNTSNNEFRVQKSLAEMTSGTVELGRPMVGRAVFKRPANFTGTFEDHDAWIIASYTSFGTRAAKHLKVHRVNIRVATAEEVGGGEVRASVEEFAYAKADVDDALALVRQRLAASLSSANEVQTPNGNNSDIGVGDWTNATLSTDVPPGAPVGARSIEVTDGARELPGRLSIIAGRKYRITGYTKSNDQYVPTARDPGGANLRAADGGFRTNTDWAFQTWYFTGETVDDAWCPAWDLAGSGTWLRFYGLRWEDITEADAVEASLSGYIEEIRALDLSALSGTALAVLLNQLGVQSDGSSATIANIQSTKVDGAGAVAAVTQEISATYGDLTALAEATAFAETTLDGIASGFVWSLGGDDVLSLVRIDDGATGPGISAKIAADLIFLSGDTVVDGSFFTDVLQAQTAWIKNANIENLTITSGKYADGSVLTPKVADNAITASGADSTNNAAPSTSDYTTYATVVLSTHGNRALAVFIDGTANGATGAGGGTGGFLFRLRKNGSTVRSWGWKPTDSTEHEFGRAFYLVSTPGTTTIEVQLRNSDVSTISANTISLFAMELKK